jgi:hypothetical protein
MAGPVLTAPNDGDLVQTTLRHLHRARFIDISSTLQKHTAMRNLLRKNRRVIRSGYGIQWDAMVGITNAAQNVGLAATDNVFITDVMTQAQADWRNTSTFYPVIGQEVDMNENPARIVDLVLTRRVNCMISLAELMESNFWGPPVAFTDNLTPFGVNTWLVKSATQGFNGGAPSGYTTIGLNPTTYPNWQNYTDGYTAVARDDLIRKMRRAATFTHFEPAVDGIPTINTGDEYGFYTNYGVIGPLEEAVESQNDSLGTDVASQDGKTLFRRVPVNWIPRLEPDTTNPIYGINWGVFKTYILNNWWLRELYIPNYPGQHTMAVHFLDCTYNFVTLDRRRNFVISNGTTYPS